MTYLSKILESHREAAAQDRRSVDRLRDAALQAGRARPFRSALLARDSLDVIAEVKRRSPSKGSLCPNLDPGALAMRYEAGGATCLSVLTDADYFGGSKADLEYARSAVKLPVLRKDFTVTLADVYDARIMGADCVLLIVAALSDHELSDLHALAREIGIDALVEVHSEQEVDRALAVGSNMIGVNQRDLQTFRVHRDAAARIAPHIPDGIVRVAQSGIAGPDDAAKLADLGYDAVLVGESLVRSPDPGAAVQAIRDRVSTITGVLTTAS